MSDKKIQPGLLLVLTLVVSLLAACDSSTPTTPTALPTPQVQPTATVDTSSIVMFAMKTSGGIAGIRRVLQVSGSGEAQLTDNGKLVGTLQLTPERFKKFVDSLDSANLFEMQDKYDKGGVADDIYDSVSFTRGTRTKVVMVAEVGGKDLAPQSLKDIITSLKQLESEIQAGATPGTTATP